MDVPSFPSSFVIERIQQLGYGTGPWRREDLVERWTEPTADKFIRDAKTAGWLVSPQRGVYYVPSAKDLRSVNWLRPEIRTEFLISRTLASANIRYWCLSRVCRQSGLDLGGPLFVTDLSDWSDNTRDPPAPKNIQSLAQACKDRTKNRQSLPWLDAVIVIPHMPRLTEQDMESSYELPEPDEVREKRVMGGALLALILAAASGGKLPGLGQIDPSKIGNEARSIPYTTGPGTNQIEWVVALLAALGLSRANEVAQQIVSKYPKIDRKKIQQYARLIGPPQPNDDWKNAITQGPFPYLLVPPALWNQMGADQAARRAWALNELMGGLIA